MHVQSEDKIISCFSIIVESLFHLEDWIARLYIPYFYILAGHFQWEQFASNLLKVVRTKVR